MCYIKYTYGNKTFIPMKIIISKHTKINIKKNIKRQIKFMLKF